jgi:hypothetical protein
MVAVRQGKVTTGRVEAAKDQVAAVIARARPMRVIGAEDSDVGMLGRELVHLTPDGRVVDSRIVAGAIIAERKRVAAARRQGVQRDFSGAKDGIVLRFRDQCQRYEVHMSQREFSLLVDGLAAAYPDLKEAILR